MSERSVVRLRAERVTDRITHHGEGPVWSVGDGRLQLVDTLAGLIVTLDPDSGATSRLRVGSVAAAFRPRASGGLVVAVERGFALVDPDGRVETLPPCWDDPTVRMNDGGTDPDGRFYCGSMAYDEGTGRGSFWRLDPDLSFRRLWGDVTVSNGFAFAPDHRHAYYIDTPTGRVDVLDYVDGELTDRRTAVADAGAPDGMAVDTEGCLWVAQFGGSQVRRYSADGTLLARVCVDARQVTACTFGGADLATLFITTSRQGLDPDDEPAAGSVFAVRPGIAGSAPLTFAG